MPDETSAKQDHPYVAHYDWSAIPGVEDAERLTPEQRAANERHALDRAAVEEGRALRFLAATPIILWSFVGIPVLALVALLALMGVTGEASDVGTITPGTVAMLALIVLIEVASIWEGTLLMKSRIDSRRWSVVLILTLIAAGAVGVLLWPWAELSSEGWVGLGAAVYSVVVAAWQTNRSRRLGDAAERLERYSP